MVLAVQSTYLFFVRENVKGFIKKLPSNITETQNVSLRHRRIRDTDAKWKGDSRGSGSKSNGAVSKQTGRSSGGGGGSVKPDGPMINRINDDAREDEMEENLQAVGGILSNLKAMSQDMNAELDKQNKGLDRMNLKVRLCHRRIFVQRVSERTLTRRIYVH